MTKQEKKEFNKKIETLFFNMEHFITPYDEKKFEKFVLNELDNQRKKILEMLEEKNVEDLFLNRKSYPEDVIGINQKYGYNKAIDDIIKEIKK